MILSVSPIPSYFLPYIFPLILSVLFFIVGCKNNFLENQANVNFNLDLSKIVETSRSDTVQNTDYILRVFAYNASNYKTGDEIENLVLLAQTESYVDINGQVKSILNIEIGLNVIFVAKLYEFVDEKLIYSGVSDVVKIKPTNNKVDLVLKKQNTDSEGDVEVYDLLGRLIASKRGGQENIQVSVPQKGIYVVKVGTETHKVVL